MAANLMHQALKTHTQILTQEPGRTLLTLAAAYLLWLTPKRLYQTCESLAQNLIGAVQARRINQDINSRPF